MVIKITHNYNMHLKMRSLRHDIMQILTNLYTGLLVGIWVIRRNIYLNKVQFGMILGKEINENSMIGKLASFLNEECEVIGNKETHTRIFKGRIRNWGLLLKNMLYVKTYFNCLDERPVWKSSKMSIYWEFEKGYDIIFKMASCFVRWNSSLCMFELWYWGCLEYR